ncbi:MAG: hypothetical protein U0792_17190 [Gemmataceae bacterium]
MKSTSRPECTGVRHSGGTERVIAEDKAKKRAADLSLVNDDPFGAGWMIKIKLAPGATLDHLLTAAQYDTQLAAEGH